MKSAKHDSQDRAQQHSRPGQFGNICRVGNVRLKAICGLGRRSRTGRRGGSKGLGHTCGTPRGARSERTRDNGPMTWLSGSQKGPPGDSNTIALRSPRAKRPDPNMLLPRKNSACRRLGVGVIFFANELPESIADDEPAVGQETRPYRFSGSSECCAASPGLSSRLVRTALGQSVRGRGTRSRTV